jgi:hypothetical protein
MALSGHPLVRYTCLLLTPKRTKSLFRLKVYLIRLPKKRLSDLFGGLGAQARFHQSLSRLDIAFAARRACAATGDAGDWIS